MITARTLKACKLGLLGLLILALLSLQIFVVAVLIEAGKSKEASLNSNPWLDIAEALSINNPDVYEAQAYYYRAQGLIGYRIGNRFSLGGQSNSKASLEKSLGYWRQAQQASPLWPYYQLSAWDIEILLDSPVLVIQNRLSAILKLAPNERGLDRALLQLAFTVWPKLNQDQKAFMLDRLKNRNSRMLKSVYAVAKAAGNHQAICINLPWNKVRRWCK